MMMMMMMMMIVANGNLLHWAKTAPALGIVDIHGGLDYDLIYKTV